jgi:hypothetical protein
VEITQEHASRLEELMAGLECPKEFICYKSGFTHVCKVRKAGAAGLLECLDASFLCLLMIHLFAYARSAPTWRPNSEDSPDTPVACQANPAHSRWALR